MTELQRFVAQIDGIAQGYTRAQVLFTANAANIFAHLQQPRTAAAVAERVGWSPRGARMLLDGLVALELVTKDEGGYRNAPIAAACLIPGQPGYQGDILRHHQNAWESWGRLGEAVRKGGPVARREERQPDELRDFILGMSNIAALSAQEMLRALDLRGVKRMLDVGGGPGSYPIAFVSAHPGMRATLFDLPAVIEIAREQVREAGLEEKVSLIAGDMLEDGFGKEYDLTLVSNIIHMFGPEQNARLVRKCFDALAPGGRLVIKDFFTDNGRTGPPFCLLFALRMLLGTEQGDTYAFSEVAEWTRAAGFEKGETLRLTPQTSLWIAAKPNV